MRRGAPSNPALKYLNRTRTYDQRRGDPNDHNFGTNRQGYPNRWRPTDADQSSNIYKIWAEISRTVSDWASKYRITAESKKLKAREFDYLIISGSNWINETWGASRNFWKRVRIGKRVADLFQDNALGWTDKIVVNSSFEWPVSWWTTYKNHHQVGKQ